MTTFYVYYYQRGCVYFNAPSAEVMAVNEDGAREVFYSTHSKFDFVITRIERNGLYNNNGRYAAAFKNKK